MDLAIRSQRMEISAIYFTASSLKATRSSYFTGDEFKRMSTFWRHFLLGSGFVSSAFFDENSSGTFWSFSFNSAISFRKDWYSFLSFSFLVIIDRRKTQILILAWRALKHTSDQYKHRTSHRNVSHCQQQQSYSGLRSSGRSNSTFWNESWVQTFHSFIYSYLAHSRLLIQLPFCPLSLHRCKVCSYCVLLYLDTCLWSRLYSWKILGGRTFPQDRQLLKNKR